MARQTGVAEKMFRALAEAGVNILAITTSEIKISALVRREQSQMALRVVHRVFQLEDEPQGAGTATAESRNGNNGNSPLDVVRRLQGMEDLTIDEITLDQSQGRVTIHGVPNKPGIAAGVFEEIARAGVFVDMIVQSFGGEQTATISFTVPQSELAKSLQVAERLAKELGCRGVTSAANVAKLSVLGIGIRSNTSVAMRMFQVALRRGHQRRYDEHQRSAAERRRRRRQGEAGA